MGASDTEVVLKERNMVIDEKQGLETEPAE